MTENNTEITSNEDGLHQESYIQLLFSRKSLGLSASTDAQATDLGDEKSWEDRVYKERISRFNTQPQAVSGWDPGKFGIPTEAYAVHFWTMQVPDVKANDTSQGNPEKIDEKFYYPGGKFMPLGDYKKSVNFSENEQEKLLFGNDEDAHVLIVSRFHEPFDYYQGMEVIFELDK